MSRESALEKEIDYLKEKYKNFFVLWIAILSGEAGLIYSVVSGEKPIYILFLAIIGAIIGLGILYQLKNIDDKIYLKLNELKEL